VARHEGDWPRGGNSEKSSSPHRGLSPKGGKMAVLVPDLEKARLLGGSSMLTSVSNMFMLTLDTLATLDPVQRGTGSLSTLEPGTVSPYTLKPGTVLSNTLERGTGSLNLFGLLLGLLLELSCCESTTDESGLLPS
jgi:hypothetical protein